MAAKRLPAQPVAGSPTTMGTGALATFKATDVEEPETSVPHMRKNAGALAVTPRLILAFSTLSAPPGLTVTGPTTLVPLIKTLSPAFTVTGPSVSAVIVRWGLGRRTA